MINQWAIMDNSGIIHQDTYEYIKDIWQSAYDLEQHYLYFPDGWEGDLLLIEIHDINK